MDVKNDSKETAKTAVLNTIANMFSLIAGMVMVPIITRIISPAELGIATTFTSTRNIFVIFLTLAAYAYVNKAMLEFKDEKKSYLFTILVFMMVSVLFCFMVAFPFRTMIIHGLSIDSFLYYWLFVSCLVLAVYNIGNSYCLFQNNYFLVALIVLAVGVASPVLSGVFAWIMPNRKYIGRLVGLDCAYISIACVVVLWLFFFSKKQFRTKYIGRTLKFTVPVIPHLLSQLILTQCDLLMISYFCGSAKTGIYSMGHTVGFLALTVVTQIMVAWSPWVYRRFEENNTEVVFRNSKLIILLGTYISLGLLTISTELIKIFFTADYAPCIYIVPPLVVAMFFQFIYMFFYDVEFYHKKSNWIAIASTVASVLNLILNWICIPAFGYIAACYTTVASYCVLLVLNYLFCRKLSVGRIYNLKYILFWVVFVIVYATVMVLCADALLIRYVLFVILTGIIVIRKFGLVKEMLLGMKNNK